MVARVWLCRGRVVALLRRALSPGEAQGLAEGFAGLVASLLERRDRELLEGSVPRLRVEGRRITVEGLLDSMEAVRARAWLSYAVERLLGGDGVGGEDGVH